MITSSWKYNDIKMSNSTIIDGRMYSENARHAHTIYSANNAKDVVFKDF